MRATQLFRTCFLKPVEGSWLGFCGIPPLTNGELPLKNSLVQWLPDQKPNLKHWLKFWERKIDNLEDHWDVLLPICCCILTEMFLYLYHIHCIFVLHLHNIWLNKTNAPAMDQLCKFLQLAKIAFEDPESSRPSSLFCHLWTILILGEKRLPGNIIENTRKAKWFSESANN